MERPGQPRETQHVAESFLFSLIDFDQHFVILTETREAFSCERRSSERTHSHSSVSNKGQMDPGNALFVTWSKGGKI